MRRARPGYRLQVFSLAAFLGSAGLSGPALAGFPGTDVFIPASARAAGAAPSQFYSTLWVTNLSSADTANVQLKFFQRDTSNTSPVTVPVSVAPGETRKYENVVQTVFGLPSASGAIRVLSDQVVLASSRTYNLPPGADLRDASGLFFTGIPQAFAIGPGESSQLQGVSQGGAEDFRYNFGMVETAGFPVTVRVTVRGADGATLGLKDYAVQAFEAKQFPVTDAVPSISTANARIDATVVSGTGAVLLYGTGIANGSQDSIGFEMSFKNAFLSAGVTSLNTLTGAVLIAGGSGINVTSAVGNQIVISAVGGGGGGLTLPYAGSAATGPGAGAFAVTNTSSSSYSSAVVGSLSSASPGSYGAGVRGTSTGTGGNGIGVWGSHSGGGWGVYGNSDTGTGVYGLSSGAEGVVGSSSSNFGVSGNSTSAYGVYGRQGAASGISDSNRRGGLWGDTTDGQGVIGTSRNNIGVEGVTMGATSYGVSAYSQGGASSYALAATGALGSKAGKFTGAVDVVGPLSKSSGSFKIDHPLDPEGKYLYHSFVESPDMMNIYNGLVALDPKGEATVALPDWFSVLNRDFRYQLTCVGGFAPVYVSREVEGNSFQIAGGRPGLKVSWQVTGVRQDAWANAHRIPVEELKADAERGFYLHPEVFDKPEEKGVEWATRPEAMRQMKLLRERLAAQARAE